MKENQTVQYLIHRAASVAVLAVVMLAAGCQTKGQTGALAGGGIGALAGQAIGGSTEATLIGAAVGAGVGYVIGNEQDKQHAAEMSRENESKGADRQKHDEVGPLGGTRWVLTNLTPDDFAEPYKSKVIEFGRDGRVLTTTTKPDGTVETADESYRVVGSTLIVNKPGYIINAKFSISGDEMVVSANEFSAVLTQLGTTRSD
jgi:outer membrane lipoprotein SlyB